MSKINTALINRLVAAGGLVVKKKAPEFVRSWHDDPDDRDREVRRYEPDDDEYWSKYSIFFNRKSEILAGIDFHDIPSVHYDALYDDWYAETSLNTRSVLAAVKDRLRSQNVI
ncbi:hypothetical protein [Acetobacter orientalis]|uniref:Uncharacterized protein n=1 Tax=Acetobacter orientalis TaxID=146474 RepID=A0A0D6NK49_9PROT|nr:hypothetical protein [Acetobacter orientalis]GAN65978.1 hypothetical protein Abor_014_143 [Acetobacter orientalis]GBR17487.1 hypothetical protein AA0481_1374 [Acetobacter orientalis NRIC 0481]GEL60348.1 hypothetical protein AOR02nite_01900 [Acetobacter orientalis]